MRQRKINSHQLNLTESSHVRLDIGGIIHGNNQDGYSYSGDLFLISLNPYGNIEAHNSFEKIGTTILFEAYLNVINQNVLLIQSEDITGKIILPFYWLWVMQQNKNHLECFP